MRMAMILMTSCKIQQLQKLTRSGHEHYKELQDFILRNAKKWHIVTLGRHWLYMGKNICSRIFSAAYNTHSNTSSNTIKDFVSVGHSNLSAFAQPATGRRAPVFQGDFHWQKGNDKNDCKWFFTKLDYEDQECRRETLRGGMWFVLYCVGLSDGYSWKILINVHKTSKPMGWCFPAIAWTIHSMILTGSQICPLEATGRMGS